MYAPTTTPSACVSVTVDVEHEVFNEGSAAVAAGRTGSPARARSTCSPPVQTRIVRPRHRRARPRVPQGSPSRPGSAPPGNALARRLLTASEKYSISVSFASNASSGFAQITIAVLAIKHQFVPSSFRPTRPPVRASTADRSSMRPRPVLNAESSCSRAARSVHGRQLAQTRLRDRQESAWPVAGRTVTFRGRSKDRIRGSRRPP